MDGYIYIERESIIYIYREREREYYIEGERGNCLVVCMYYLGDCEHPAEEEPGEDVVVVGVLPEPHLDLDEIVLGGGVAASPRSGDGGGSGSATAGGGAGSSCSCCCCIIGAGIDGEDRWIWRKTRLPYII
jgi:hypothetical protein